MSAGSKNLKLSGKTLAPGLGSGRVFVYPDVLTRLDEFYDIEASQAAEEVQRFERAVASVSGDLSSLSGRVSKEIDHHLSEVFLAHLAMVQDASLKTEVHKQIRDEYVSAGTAVKNVFRRWERRFRSMEANIAAQKGDDIRDLARRLITSLAGIRGHALESMPLGSVLVATRLLPSDTVFLARRSAAAAILEVGGRGSHAALFAHEIGLPCVSGIKKAVEMIPAGERVLVDADTAEVILNPNSQRQMDFQAKCRRQEQGMRMARHRAHESAVTRDGRVIGVFANVGGVEDVREAVRNGADGIGLYRIERAYLGRQEPPDSDLLLDEMRKTLEPARGLPVSVRLLDIGADKPLPFMESCKEINPSLGLRGIRFLLEYPDLLQSQLDALLQLSVEFELHVIVPMVTLSGDIQRIRQALEESALRLKTSSLPKLGAMIETPAAALTAGEIAEYADFLSFGTNDLTQYAFAADRENAAVDAYYHDGHTVIFRLLRAVHEDVPDIPLSICGELAGRPAYTSKILACGIDTLSVAPPSIPMIKEAIRRI